VNKPKWSGYLSPLFAAIFPILSLANENLVFIRPISILRSTLLSISITAIFYILFYLLLRNWNKAAILSSILIILLATYGNVYGLFREQMGEDIRHVYLLIAYVLVYGGIAAFVIFGLKNAKDINNAILVGGVAMAIYLSISIGYYEYQVYQSDVSTADTESPFTTNLTEEEISGLPDIYLILLDGHTRSDILQDVYGYDNSEFIDELKEMGFWVPDCAQSNYPSTNFSITSLFQMEYLHHVYEDYDNLVFPPLNNTAVFNVLEDHNYSIVTFHNFVFQHFNIKDDIRYRKENKNFGSINEFEKMVVDNSILRLLVEMDGVFPAAWSRPFEDDFYLTHYRDTQYALETLPELPKLEGNNFVYAHLLVTHDPFVFMPDGSFNTSYKITPENYTYTVEYIDSTLPSIAEKIIENSDTPPIILIMGDHGAPLKGTPIGERIGILLAVYLQGKEPAGFYEGITPVNVFRLMFNNLLDTQYELIDDKSYEIWQTSELGRVSKQIFQTCTP